MIETKPKIVVEKHYLQGILENATSDIDLEIKINEVARYILTTSDMSKEEKEQAWSELLRARTTYLGHVPVNLLKGSVLFFNMMQIGLAPTPLCPAYNKMRCATISDYGNIGSNIVIIRLDPSAMKHVPPVVLEKVGNLSEKKVDLMFTVVDGRPFVGKDCINLCTHAWAHPHALEKDWIEGDVNMGVFPEIGFEHHDGSGSVAFNDICPMWVHTHYDRGAPLYSPNNAHFRVIPDSPFGTFWSVTQKDDRVAITKMIVVLDYKHPICVPLIESTRGCNKLSSHLRGEYNGLPKVEKGIQNTFLPIITAYKNNDPDAAIQMFNKLPLSFQLGIYKEVWLLAGSPKDIHNDFGKAAFENDSLLSEKFHCNDLARAQAISNFADTLIHLLVSSEIALTEESQALCLGDNALKMLQCAHLLESGQAKDVIELFVQFSWKEQDDIFLAIWELSKCPRGNMSFGKDTFLNPNTPLKIKIEALCLAASRQPPKFDGEVIEIKEKTPIYGDIITNKSSCIQDLQPLNIEFIKNEPPISSNTITSEPRVIEIIEQTPSIIQIATPELSSIMTPQEVLEALMSLAFDNIDFMNSGINDRKSSINELFNHLPTDIKNQIYGRVYQYSIDPDKGGDNWGQNHVADDLNVLIEALQDVLFG